MSTEEQMPDEAPLSADDLPSLDDGPGVLVSMRAEPATDERARAFAKLRAFVPNSAEGSASRE